MNLLQDIVHKEVEIASVEVNIAKARVALPEIPLELSVRAVAFFYEKEACELMLKGQQRRTLDQGAIFLPVVSWTGESIHVVARDCLLGSFNESGQIPF